MLFDVGMTLIHVNGDVLSGCFAEEGAQVDPSDAVAALVLAAEARHLDYPRGADGDGRVARHLGFLLNVVPSRAEAAFARALCHPELYSVLDPGAHATLAELKERGVCLAAVANADGRLEQELGAFDLARYFDVLVDSQMLGVEKPDARIFDCAAERLGVPLQHSWYVGDGLVNDVLGACGAGIGRAILYDRPRVRATYRGVTRITELTQLTELLCP